MNPQKQIKIIFYLLVFCLILLGFHACRSVQPSLKLLSASEIQNINWEDDLPLHSLEEALQHSENFYKRMPDWKRFSFGEKKYSPKEMMASNARLLEILKTTQGQKRSELIEKEFFVFESQNKNQNAFFTGYYEPILQGSKTQSLQYPVPIYAKPPDLIRVKLSQFSSKLPKKTIWGKLQGNQLVPYDSRAKIVGGSSLANRAKVLVYTRHHIELFFLQIQGSGVIRLPDGSLMQLNYAGKNGLPYRSIGRLLIRQGKMERAKISMQSLKKYLYEHPEEVDEILFYNPSYVFFRENRISSSPVGYMGEPLTAKRSLAVDYRLIPMGGVALIQTQQGIFKNGKQIGSKKMNRFASPQDTGGVIRGHGRIDIFWGRGADAALHAGHQKSTGRLFLIVAKKESK